jgi:hypothetical protein
VNFHYIAIVKYKKEIGLDFIVDKLTNSIENVVTGDSFPTDISILTEQDFKKNQQDKWLAF